MMKDYQQGRGSATVVLLFRDSGAEEKTEWRRREENMELLCENHQDAEHQKHQLGCQMFLKIKPEAETPGATVKNDAEAAYVFFCLRNPSLNQELQP